ncbi:MAG: glutathione S-transferase [Myxococcota bacterium]
MLVYKSDISYFSGKVEAYLHLKGIPHEVRDTGYFGFLEIERATGVKKMPAIALPDGRWLYDSTWLIRWLEDEHPSPAVRLEDPVQEFVAFLIEDYGDEWLWRPAMWWRWVPPVAQRQVGRRIAREFFGPFFNGPIGAWFALRQRREWLYRDGVTRRNDGWVQQLYRDELATLNRVLANRPFVLGQRPTWADFGYMGSMFRHFGCDDEPSEVMRREAPAVYTWVARMWEGAGGAPGVGFDTSGLDALFARIRGDYLPYLEQNASAHDRGAKRFDLDGATATLRGSVTTTYRVHAWNALLAQWARLTSAQQHEVERLVGDLGILRGGARVECGLPDVCELPVTPGTAPAIRVRTLLGQPRN